MFAEKTVSYNGVDIVVKPLPFHRIPAMLEILGELLPSDGTDSGDWKAALPKLTEFINECVTVPEDPDIKFSDLPADASIAAVEGFVDASPFWGTCPGR